VAFEPGDQPVPGYRLDSFLGQGSYGSVWKAVGPGGVPCAMKFISLDSKSGLKEMRAIGLVKKLQHPNLCPVQAIWLRDREGNLMSDTPGSESTRFLLGGNKELIIAMGLGQKTLAQRLEECRGRGGVPIRDLIRYMEDAAKGIDYLNEPVHDLGGGPSMVIHCDIKPANLLIVGGGVQVCDYGVARALSSTGDAIRKTFAAGTPAYAPAELINNEPTLSSDQYSLAISYFELRTGHLPFDEAKALIANLTGQLDLSDLPPEERDVIRRATSLRPADRFETCLDMIEELKVAVQVTMPGKSMRQPLSGGMPSSGSTNYPILTPRSTPQPPENPRFTPPPYGNPRGTDRIRTTPEPPAGYGTNEGVWPPGADSNRTQNPAGANPPNTPIKGGYGPSEAESNGTLQFDPSSHPYPQKAKSFDKGFAEDPVELTTGPSSNPYDAPPSSRRGQQNKPSQKPPSSRTEGTQPPKSKTLLLVMLLLGTVLLLGGGVALFFVMKGKGSNTTTTPSSSPASSSTPTTSPPTKSDDEAINTLSNDIKAALDKGNWVKAESDLSKLEKLNSPKAKLMIPEFSTQIALEKEVEPIVTELTDAIKQKNSERVADTFNRLKAKHPKRAEAFRELVASLPPPGDTLRSARVQFKNGQISAGLKELKDAVDSKKFNSDEAAIAKKLADLWTPWELEVKKPGQSLTDLRSLVTASQSLEKSALPDDLPDFRKQTALELTRRLEKLIPSLNGIKVEDWEWLAARSTNSEASPVVKALGVEAALELAYANPTKKSNLKGLIPNAEADQMYEKYPAYLKGLLDFANGVKADQVVNTWQSQFGKVLPNWVNLNRAKRMADVVNQALPSDDPRLVKQRLTAWKDFLQPISKLTGVQFEPPSDLDTVQLGNLFAVVQRTDSAKIDSYQTLYKSGLKTLLGPDGNRLVSQLPAAKKPPFAKLFRELGQHMLVNSLAWNAIPEMQQDKMLAESAAEKILAASATLSPNDEVSTWLEIAKLLQPNAQVGPTTNIAAGRSSPEAKLLTALIARTNARVPGSNEVDIKLTIQATRKVHDSFRQLMDNKSTNPELTRLIRKQAIQQALQLVEVDQSSGFYQEMILRRIAPWIAELSKSPDDLLLLGRYTEAFSRIIKPPTWLSPLGRDVSYRKAMTHFSEVEGLIGTQSVELKLAEARTAYSWETDKLSRPGAKLSARIFEASEEKIKQTAELLKRVPHSGWEAQFALVAGQIQMLAAEDQSQGDEPVYTRYANAIQFFQDGLTAAKTLEGGQWHDQLWSLKLPAQEKDIRLALARNHPALLKKLEAYANSTKDLNALSGRSGIKAWSKMIQKILETAADSGQSTDFTRRYLSETVEAIKAAPILTQDADYLAQCYLELANLELKNIGGFNTPEQRAVTKPALGKAIVEWDKAYKLLDTHPFMPATKKTIIADTLGMWYRFLGDAHNNDHTSATEQKNAPLAETELGLARKNFQLAAETLKWALSYSVSDDRTWVTQTNFAYAAALYYRGLNLKKTDPNYRTLRVEQVNYLVDTVAAMLDASARSVNVAPKEPRKIELEYWITLSDVLLKDITEGLQEFNDLTPLEQATWRISQAELHLIPDKSKGNPDLGKKLAKEWIPKLKVQIETNDQVGFSRAYHLRRQIERVEKLMDR
jgi:serine/threonine protein kinase